MELDQKGHTHVHIPKGDSVSLQRVDSSVSQSQNILRKNLLGSIKIFILHETAERETNLIVI